METLTYLVPNDIRRAALPPGTLEICDAFLSKAAELRARAEQRALPFWTPQPGPQEIVWNLDCDEIGYGGAAGGGKTGLIVAMPMQRAKMRGYRALVLRRSTPDLAKIIDEAKDIYQDGRTAGRFSFRAFAPPAEGLSRFRGDINWLTFPEWGSRIEFGHCHNLDDYRSRMGQEYDDLFFDEVTQFERIQYVSIASRRRGTIRGARRRVLATMNPPEKNEPGEAWVRERWAPWIDPECDLHDWGATDERGHTARGKGLPPRIEGGRRVPPAQSAQILYVAQVNGKERFSTEPFEWEGAAAQSRTFVAAKLTDNQAMMEAEPNYVAKLRDHDPVRARQLEHGDWAIRPAAGRYFRREWMPAVAAIPPGRTIAVRRWDLAGTEPHPQNPDPDWTSGVLLVKHQNGLYYLTDIARTRQGPGGVKAFVDATIVADGKEVWQRFAEDPGQAGKAQAGDYVAMAVNHGVNASAARETGAKALRIQRVSAAVAPKPGETVGRFRIVTTPYRTHDTGAPPVPWLHFFLQQAEGWPDVNHDDDLDALAGAYDVLANAFPSAGAEPEPPVNWAEVGRGFR